MLTLEPARERRRAGRTRLAIALAGGGPLGAFYEIGALHALSESIEGRDVIDADVYTGVSSGALVAAGIANGLDTTTMCERYIEDDLVSQFPFTPEMLLRPAFAEYAMRLCKLPTTLARAARQYVLEPQHGAWSAAVGSIGRMVPAAVFDNGPLEDYLRTLLDSPGHTDDFRKLKARLYIVATNLNTGESVHFGGPGNDRVPISRAVLASTALPGLYSPVEIDGQHFVDGALVRTMNASLALEEGCNLVICINPLVPFDASKARTRAHTNLADEGLPTVLAQTFRSLIYSRMKVGMASYRLRYPAADTLLLEPDRSDERLFFTNVFGYRARKMLAEHAYQSTRRDLRTQAEPLDALLRRHGMHLNMERLRDRKRTFMSAMAARSGRARHAARDLDRALRKLERMIPSRRTAL